MALQGMGAAAARGRGLAQTHGIAALAHRARGAAARPDLTVSALAKLSSVQKGLRVAAKAQ